ncbi:hypothetical protein [Luteimonas saliphila]|uniref:hypothetical protein n=1 Tax=Luteimonas saliphila TaxID=2804919 RepID=UPI00192E2451|nr:hypothetical protein [Luteimonas saliphila]
MATRSLGALTLDIIAKIGGFEQGMDKAARVADQRMKQIEARAKKFGVAVGVALVAGAGIVANELRKAINSMDELTKAAQRANVPVEEFTKLAHAASLADVQIQDLQSSMGRLAKAQGDALKETSQQGRIFEALGIAVKDAGGNLRSTYEVFLDFADAFKRNQGSPEIMAAGLLLFGRSFQNLVPLLKEGSQGLRDAGDEAERLGLVFSAEAGANAEKFNDDLTRLRGALRGVWVEIAQQLLPQLSETTDRLQQLARDGDLASNAVSVISAAMKSGVWIIEQYNNAVARTSIAIETVANSASGLAEIMRNVGVGGLLNEGSVRDGMAKVAKAFEDGQKQLDNLIERQNSPWRNVRSGSSTVTPGGSGPDNLSALGLALGDAPKRGGKSEAQKQAEQLQRSYDSLMETMRERIDLMGVESEVSQMLYRVTNGDLKALDDTRKQALLTLAEEFDAKKMLREEIEKENKEREETQKRIKDGLKYGEEVLDHLRFELELMRMGNAERAAAIQLYGMESEAVAKYGEAIIQANRDIEEQLRQIDVVDDFRSEFADFFEDVLTGTKSIKDAFRDMLDNINRMILRRINENWVEQLFGQMGTTQTGSSGGWLQLFGSLFGSGRANGGGVKAGMIYPVTEFGDEMLTVRGRNYLLPASSGTVTSNQQMARGGGGVVFNNTNNFNRPVTRSTGQQISLEIAQKTRMATVRDS